MCGNTLSEEENNLKTIKSSIPHYRLNLISISVAFFGLSTFYTVESQFLNSYIIKVLNESAFLVAFMVTFSAIGGLIVFIIAGAMSDGLPNNKWGRRRPFALAGIFAGVFIALIPFYANYTWVFLIDVIILSIFGNLANAARKAVIPEIFPIEIRGSVNSWFSFAEIIGGGVIIGVSFLALLLFPITETKVGNDVIYSGAQPMHIFTLVTAGIMTVVSCIIFTLTIREPKIDYEPIPWTIALKQIFNKEELKKNNAFMRFMIIMTLVKISDYTFNPYLMTYIMSTSLTLLQLGLLAGCYAVGMVIAFKLFGKWLDNNPRKKITLRAVLFEGIGFTILGLFGNLQNLGLIETIFTTIGLLIGIFGFTGLGICQNAWSQDLFPIESRGKFSGILNIVFTASQIPGVFFGAILFEFLGIQYVFLGAAILVLLFGQLYRYAQETYLGKIRK